MKTLSSSVLFRKAVVALEGFTRRDFVFVTGMGRYCKHSAPRTDRLQIIPA